MFRGTEPTVYGLRGWYAQLVGRTGWSQVGMEVINTQLSLANLIDHIYSSFSLIKPPYLPRNCGHIRELAFVEREGFKYIDSSSGKDLRPHWRGWRLLRVATKRGTTS